MLRLTNDDRERMFGQRCGIMDKLYGNLARFSYGNHPLCLPESLCFKPDWIKLVPEKKNNDKDKTDFGNWKGQRCEKQTLAALQNSSVGGVAVFDIDVHKFCLIFDYDPSHLHPPDGVLFHPQLGIYIFESKASKRAMIDSVKDEQSAGLTRTIKILYQNVTGIKNETDIPPITFVYAMHDRKDGGWVKEREESYCYRFFFNEGKGTEFKYADHLVLDKKVLNSPEKLTKFFNRQITDKEKTNDFSMDYFSDEKYMKFLKVIASFRSEKNYYCKGSNVFAIHKGLTLQDFTTKKKKVSQTNEGENCREFGNESVFLTAQQLAIVESLARFEIIIGVPGSGKTLITILKAYNAAQQNPSSELNEKVVIFAGSEAMAMKYREIFKAWEEKGKCKREVHKLSCLLDYSKNDFVINQHDDLFLDECSWAYDVQGPLLQQRIEAAKKNPSNVGQTLLVVTDAVHGRVMSDGFLDDYEVILAEAKKLVKEINFSMCQEGPDELPRKPSQSSLSAAFHCLKTNIRCTGAILDEWKNDYNNSSKSVKISKGHCIEGCAVHFADEGLESIQTIASAVHNYIQEHLVTLSEVDSELDYITSKDIAVLFCLHEFSVPNSQLILDALKAISIIANEEKSTSISYGSIQEQMIKGDCVAVGHARDALSCEWALVIVIEDKAAAEWRSEKHWKMVSRSRATAKLAIFRSSSLATNFADVDEQITEEIVNSFKKYKFPGMQIMKEHEDAWIEQTTEIITFNPDCGENESRKLRLKGFVHKLIAAFHVNFIDELIAVIVPNLRCGLIYGQTIEEICEDFNQFSYIHSERMSELLPEKDVWIDKSNMLSEQIASIFPKTFGERQEYQTKTKSKISKANFLLDKLIVQANEVAIIHETYKKCLSVTDQPTKLTIGNFMNTIEPTSKLMIVGHNKPDYKEWLKIYGRLISLLNRLISQQQHFHNLDIISLINGVKETYIGGIKFFQPLDQSLIHLKMTKLINMEISVAFESVRHIKEAFYEFSNVADSKLSHSSPTKAHVLLNVKLRELLNGLQSITTTSLGIFQETLKNKKYFLHICIMEKFWRFTLELKQLQENDDAVIILLFLKNYLQKSQYFVARFHYLHQMQFTNDTSDLTAFLSEFQSINVILEEVYEIIKVHLLPECQLHVKNLKELMKKIQSLINKDSTNQIGPETLGQLAESEMTVRETEEDNLLFEKAVTWQPAWQRLKAYMDALFFDIFNDREPQLLEESADKRIVELIKSASAHCGQISGQPQDFNFCIDLVTRGTNHLRVGLSGIMSWAADFALAKENLLLAMNNLLEFTSTVSEDNEHEDL